MKYKSKDKREQTKDRKIQDQKEEQMNEQKRNKKKFTRTEGMKKVNKKNHEWTRTKKVISNECERKREPKKERD